MTSDVTPGPQQGDRVPLQLRIRSARQQAGLRQEDLAQRLGVSRFAVIRWEGGENVPAPEQRLRLAQVLGGVPDDYLKHEDEPATDAQLAQEVGMRSNPTTAEVLEQEIESLKDEVQRLHRHLEEVEAGHQERLERLEYENRVLMAQALRERRRG